MKKLLVSTNGKNSKVTDNIVSVRYDGSLGKRKYFVSEPTGKVCGIVHVNFSCCCKVQIDRRLYFWYGC